MGIFGIVLLTAALLVLVGAEWPRLSARFGADARAGRLRRRRKSSLTLIHGEAHEDDDFAASVERDLANLPVLGDRDERSRR